MQKDGDAPCQSPALPLSKVSLPPTRVYSRGHTGVPEGVGVGENTDTGVTDTVGVLDEDAVAARAKGGSAIRARAATTATVRSQGFQGSAVGVIA
jgi:hypothetical protein